MSSADDTMDTADTSATGAAPDNAIDPRLAAMLGLLGGGGLSGLAGVGGLDGLGASAGIDSMTALRAQFETLAAQQPQLAPLMQMLMQRAGGNAAPNAEGGSEDRAGDGATDSTPTDPDAAIDPSDLAQLLRHTEALEDELDALRLRNDTLAAALGACHLCFGGHRGCDVCGGRGAPGWRRPESNAFRRFVAPALHRLQTGARSSRPPGPPSPDRPFSVPPFPDPPIPDADPIARSSTQRKAGCHHV